MEHHSLLHLILLCWLHDAVRHWAEFANSMVMLYSGGGHSLYIGEHNPTCYQVHTVSDFLNLLQFLLDFCTDKLVGSPAWVVFCQFLPLDRQVAASLQFPVHYLGSVCEEDTTTPRCSNSV